MLGINRLNKKVAELDEEIHFLKCMIYDLQNPYTLNIGNKVNVYKKDNELSINLKQPQYAGIVVSLRYNYDRKPPYFLSKHRVNYYTIYNDYTKETNELTDDIYLFELKQ